MKKNDFLYLFAVLAVIYIGLVAVLSVPPDPSTPLPPVERMPAVVPEPPLSPPVIAEGELVTVEAEHLGELGTLGYRLYRNDTLIAQLSRDQVGPGNTVRFQVRLPIGCHVLSLTAVNARQESAPAQLTVCVRPAQSV